MNQSARLHLLPSAPATAPPREVSDLLDDVKLDALNACEAVQEMLRRYYACPDERALNQVTLAVQTANRRLNEFKRKRHRLLADLSTPAGRLRPGGE